MKKCTQCGETLIEGKKFCFSCGMAVNDMVFDEGSFCAQCGAKLIEGKSFCHNCGHKVNSMKNSDIENDNEIQNDNANKESVVDKIKSEASGVSNVVKEKVSKVYSKCANTPQRVILSIVVLAAAVGCIVATIAYRAWLGGIFYIGAAILADYVIRANDKDEEGKIRPNFIIEYCQYKEFNPPQYILKAFKDGDIWDKISSGVVVLFPIVIAVIVFLWIYVDTSRDYAHDMKRIDEQYKKEMYRIDREYEEEMKRIDNEYGFDY